MPSGDLSELPDRREASEEELCITLLKLAGVEKDCAYDQTAIRMELMKVARVGNEATAVDRASAQMESVSEYVEHNNLDRYFRIEDGSWNPGPAKIPSEELLESLYPQTFGQRVLGEVRYDTSVKRDPARVFDLVEMHAQSFKGGCGSGEPQHEKE
ncbi:unnamed protein product [Discosporangium mesarthrocarpum]